MGALRERTAGPACLAVVCWLLVPGFGAGLAAAQVRDSPGARTLIVPREDFDPIAQEPGRIFRLGGALALGHNLNFARPQGQPSYTNFTIDYEADLVLNVTRYVTLNTGLRIEQVRAPPRDGFLRDHGGWIDQLFLGVHLGPLTVYGGKIHPRFGLAWTDAPGLFSADFAGEYELVERLGFGAMLRLPIDFGEHDLSAEWFRADTSFLTRSAFTRTYPGDADATRYSRLSRADGGLSNSDGPSYSFVLTGRDLPLPAGLGTAGYQISYSRQAPGTTETRAQHGFSIGVTWEIPLAADLALAPMLEFAGFDGADGLDQRRNYYTFGAALTWRAWAVAASSTLRPTSSAEGRARDYMVALSVGYDLSSLTRIDGLAASIGWRRSREDGQRADIFGAELVHRFSF